MSSYYYFVATLPSLQSTAVAPPFSHADFMERASHFLSEKDAALLGVARLFVPGDGAPPPASAPSDFLSRYFRWESALRNELARLRAGRMQKSAEKFLRQAAPEGDAQRTAQAAFQAGDPLQGELAIEHDRWSYIELLASNHYFDIEFLMAYSLLLQVLERKARFNAEKGQEGYRTVYRSVLETADYRDESGENT